MSTPTQDIWADRIADVIAEFAVSTNPVGLSVGIDQAYELADKIVESLSLRSSDGGVGLFGPHPDRGQDD